MKDVMLLLSRYLKLNSAISVEDKQRLDDKIQKCWTTEDLMLVVYMNQNTLFTEPLPNCNNNIDFLIKIEKVLNKFPGVVLVGQKPA